MKKAVYLVLSLGTALVLGLIFYQASGVEANALESFGGEWGVEVEDDEMEVEILEQRRRHHDDYSAQGGYRLQFRHREKRMDDNVLQQRRNADLELDCPFRGRRYSDEACPFRQEGNDRMLADERETNETRAYRQGSAGRPCTRRR